MTYEVGRYYRIPHVRTRWGGNSLPEWIPIIGPAHNDIEVIGFEHEHWHVDFRFLSVKKKRQGTRWDVDGAEVFVLPVSTVWPLPVRNDPDYDTIRVGDLTKRDVPLEAYYRVKKVLCKGQYPDLPLEGGLPWIRKLEAAYADTRLKKGLVCPHKGADLSTFVPDEKDFVTCPLHGLQWNVVTGELVPVDLTEEQEEKRRHYPPGGSNV